MNDPTTYLLVTVLVGASAMWILTLLAGLWLTVQAFLKDSFSIATAASFCAGIHVVLAALTKFLHVVYLPAAVVVFLLATIAGTRSMLRHEHG